MEKENVLLKGTLLQGRFEIEEVIGSGGFGIVYKARDRLVYREVAVKEFFHETDSRRDPVTRGVLEPETDAGKEVIRRCRQLFVQEAAVMEKLKNTPYTARILDHFSENGTLYTVMNLLDGESLEEGEKRPGEWSAEELLPMMEKAMYALEKMHEQGFLHRDISPGNLFKTREGDLYLIDFGTATALDADSVLHNPEFFSHKGFHAPEHADLPAQGTWTDVYNMAAVILYLLTANPVPLPQSRMNYDPVPQWILHCGLSAPQQNALLKALKISTAERTTTMQELRIGLCREMYAFPTERKVWYTAMTARGKRENNQDNLTVDGLFFYKDRDFERTGEILCHTDELHAAAVCDGVGGAIAGELASLAAVQAIRHFMEENEESDRLPECLLENLLDQMNEKIVALQKKIGQTATTLSMLLWKGPHYYTVNIGDSPIYLLRNHKLTRLSTPHTKAEEKLAMGKVPEPEDFHTLTCYLGKKNVAGSRMKSFCHGHIENGDVFLIASDGLLEAVGEEKLTGLMKKKGEAFLKTIHRGMKTGGNDNCSVIRVCFDCEKEKKSIFSFFGKKSS